MTDLSLIGFVLFVPRFFLSTPKFLLRSKHDANTFDQKMEPIYHPPLLVHNIIEYHIIIFESLLKFSNLFFPNRVTNNSNHSSLEPPPSPLLLSVFNYIRSFKCSSPFSLSLFLSHSTASSSFYGKQIFQADNPLNVAVTERVDTRDMQINNKVQV